MSDNIIDFNQRKREKEESSRQDVDFSPEAIMSRLTDAPENELMRSIAAVAHDRLTKVLFLIDIAAKASEALKGIGFDPDNFTVVEESVERFLSTPFEFDDDVQWNGPWFDWEDDARTVRLASTIRMEEESESGQPVTISMNLLCLNEGADNWMIYTGEDWMEGPAEDYFDDPDTWGDWDDIDDDDDWDDDDDDDDDWDEDWTDEDETSVSALALRPTVITALIRGGIETFDQLRAATDEQLLAIEGITPQILRRVRLALEDQDDTVGE